MHILRHLRADLHTKYQGLWEEWSESHEQTAKATPHIGELNFSFLMNVGGTKLGVVRRPIHFTRLCWVHEGVVRKGVRMGSLAIPALLGNNYLPGHSIRVLRLLLTQHLGRVITRSALPLAHRSRARTVDLCRRPAGTCSAEPEHASPAGGRLVAVTAATSMKLTPEIAAGM